MARTLLASFGGFLGAGAAVPGAVAIDELNVPRRVTTAWGRSLALLVNRCGLR